ncbi:hypothetical protein [Helicobacter pylori]|nr:hypothetical protein [Helicobacter pylori]
MHFYTPKINSTHFNTKACGMYQNLFLKKVCEQAFAFKNWTLY